MDFDYPEFTLSSYGTLLARLRSRWNIVRVAEAFRRPFQPATLILRHDIDLSPAVALPMAAIEHDLGVRATYFVGLHLHYNAHLPLHAEVIRRLGEMGHEIGLHYDGTLYPDSDTSPEPNQVLLDRHVQILQEISGCPVVSIARHDPSLATRPDPFRNSRKYHNAYDPAVFTNTVYISDSCGAWRADGLRACWREPRPLRIYLLVHPEQWGDTAGPSRMAHFELVRARVIREHDDFFEHVRTVWRTHTSGQEHDLRVRNAPAGSVPSGPDRPHCLPVTAVE
jgi:hypothetical protein